MTSAGTDEALDAEVRDAIANAAYFMVSLWHRYGHETHPLKSLAYAFAAAELLPQARGSSRKAIVYAVTKDGRSVMIPERFAP